MCPSCQKRKQSDIHDDGDDFTDDSEQDQAVVSQSAKRGPFPTYISREMTVYDRITIPTSALISFTHLIIFAIRTYQVAF